VSRNRGQQRNTNILFYKSWARHDKRGAKRKITGLKAPHPPWLDLAWPGLSFLSFSALYNDRSMTER
jgi:hypothetical protein